MGILKNIEWTDSSSDLIIWKYPINKDQVNKGSALTVRESQVAIFVDKGRLADVFLPGYYKLDTQNMPVLKLILQAVFEMTSAVNNISTSTVDLNIKISLTSAVLSFGGISVIMQILGAAKMEFDIKSFIFSAWIKYR